MTAAKVVSEVPERALLRGGHIASGSHLTGASGVHDNTTTVIETADDGPGSQSNIALPETPASDGTMSEQDASGPFLGAGLCVRGFDLISGIGLPEVESGCGSIEIHRPAQSTSGN